MTEICPFAKVKGFFRKRVICVVINEEVDHDKFGCLTPNYKSCPIYLRKVENEKRGDEVVAPETEDFRNHNVNAEEKKIEEMVNEHVKKSIEKFKNPLKGEIPESCYDCIFYSPTTRRCVFLMKIVEKPEEPPCKEKFERASS